MNEQLDPIKATELWLERTVVGLDLCPFARRPWRAGRVRMVQAAGSTPEDWLAHVLEEGRLLLEEKALAETSLVVLPDALSFSDVLDLQAAGEALLEALGLEGVLQLVPFHPSFCFEGASQDDPANRVNQSPHPLLHVLLAAAVLEASASIDVSRLTLRNAALLRRGWAPPDAS